MKKAIALLLIFTQTAWAALAPTNVNSLGGTSLKTHSNITVPNNQATDLGGLGALIETGNMNLLADPGFESGTVAKWTKSGTGTWGVSQTSTYGGKYAGLLSLSSQQGEVSQDVTPLNATNGIPMVAACAVKNVSALSDISVCARTGGTDIQCTTVSTLTSWQLIPVNFSGPADGTTVGVSVKNGSSESGNILVDECYVGSSSTPQNFGQVSQAVLYGSVSIASCGGAWTTTSGSLTNFSAQTGCVYTATGNAQAPSTNVPGFKFASLPPGDYALVADSQFTASGSSHGSYYRFSDGTNSAREESVVQSNASGALVVPGIYQTISYSTAQSNITLQIQGAADPSGTASISGTSLPTVIKIYRFPSASEVAYRADLQPASWSGYFTGASWTSTQTSSFADLPSNASTTLTQTTAQNMTCTPYNGAGSAKPGLVCNFGRAGIYNVCMQGSFQVSSTSPVENFQLVDGSGTVIDSHQYAATGTAAPQQISLCNDYNVTAAGSVTFKVQYFASSAATTTLLAASPALNSWNITPKTGNLPSPLLMGSVTSTSAGQEHIERARIANNGTATVTSQSASPAWTVNRSALGVVDITFNTTWTTAPMCTCSAEIGGRTCALTSLTTTTAQVQILNTSAVNEDRNFSIICMGPR